MHPQEELDELRGALEQTLGRLDGLFMRGLRACGPDELAQIRAHAEQFEQSDAGRLGSLLRALHDQIAQDQPASARTLLEAQSHVRLLERLLTLRVVRGRYALELEARARLNLREASRLTCGDAFTDWPSCLDGDLAGASSRLEQFRPSPMDLEIEFQEEAIVSTWSAVEEETTSEGFDLAPITSGRLELAARLD
jgi:hypothetical protein